MVNAPANTSVNHENPSHEFTPMNVRHATQNVAIMLISEPPIQCPSPRSKNHPHASHRDIAQKRALYADELEKAGHSMEGRVIPMARNIALGKTQSEAEEVARNGARFMFGNYLPPGIGAVAPPTQKGAPPPGPSPGPSAGVWETGPQGTSVDPVEQYVNEVVICGTPEKVIDDLQELGETLPLEYLMCTPLSHASFELFTEKVLPSFL